MRCGRGGGFDRGGGGGGGGRGGGGGGSAADFLLSEEMEGDPSGREEVEAAAIKINDSNKCQCLSSSIVSTTAVNDE